MWIESCFSSWSGKVKLSLLLQWLIKASNWLINNNKLIINMYVKKFRLVTTGLVPATIPDETAWESFPHHVHFPTQQNYFQNDAFGERKPPNSMLLPTNAQGSGFLLHTQHYFQGKGERGELVQLRRLEKCFPSMQFSQQFCPRL